jgi:hypothetical protein
MYPHRIRLRGPWECEPLAYAGERAGQVLPAPRRVVMPCRWGDTDLAGFTGRARFRRRFGYPGRIDAHERVWLRIEGIAGEAAVWLNGLVLSSADRSSGALEFDVTALLHARNELSIEAAMSAGQEDGIWSEAVLEVRCAAFLSGVRCAGFVRRDRVTLHVTGQVVGTADRPLETYVLMNGATVGYQAVNPCPEGQPFEILISDIKMENRDSSGEPLLRAAVQVDLVNGAVVWYTCEVPVMVEPANHGG